MPLSSPSKKEPNGAESTPNAVMVREQLRRLLAHPLFTNSKRYPVLLAYTVEQALDGNSSGLKERTIGVEAFGRKPDYDVNLDPVVRTTAAEVRKRLIQYYYSPDHAGELVIELPVGSYVPCFREPATPHTGLAPEPIVARENESSPLDHVTSPTPQTNAEQAPSGLTVRHWIWIAVALLFAAFIGFGAGRVKFPDQLSNLDHFWEPFTATSGRITYCLGVPGRPVDRENTPSEGTLPRGNLDISDVIALARSIVPLMPRKSSFLVVRASDTGFTQLREGPFVLIGAYDNIWTMRITQDLPFGFESDTQGRRIVDRKSAQKRFWSLPLQIPPTKREHDYAIIARIYDNITRQPVIILAGIHRQGTEAAGELVSNPVYLDAMLQKAPKNWDQLNLEAVIETQVIDGHAGPPAVIAVEIW